MPAISTRRLGRHFDVPVREPGLMNAVKSLVRREHRRVHAVRDVDLSSEQGEVVGFLGANGAGKTTTLKMLSGLLHPTDGEASVLGYEPKRREHDLLRQIALVMGNRNQLQWDLPVEDSFEMHRAVYGVPNDEYRRTRDELVELMDIGDLLERPAEHTRTHGSTATLTSHYTEDVKALCDRVVVIHEGTIRHDGPLGELAERFAPHRTLSFTVPDATFDPTTIGEVESVEGGRAAVRVDRDRANEVAASLLSTHGVADLTVTDPPIDDVIEQVFASATADDEADAARRDAVEDGDVVAESTS